MDDWSANYEIDSATRTFRRVFASQHVAEACPAASVAAHSTIRTIITCSNPFTSSKKYIYRSKPSRVCSWVATHIIQHPKHKICRYRFFPTSSFSWSFFYDQRVIFRVKWRQVSNWRVHKVFKLQNENRAVKKTKMSKLLTYRLRFSVTATYLTSTCPVFYHYIFSVPLRGMGDGTIGMGKLFDINASDTLEIWIVALPHILDTRKEIVSTRYSLVPVPTHECRDYRGYNWRERNHHHSAISHLKGAWGRKS